MGDLTAADVRAELDAWLDENWDPDLTVADWWKRLAEGRWSSPAMPTEAGGPVSYTHLTLPTICSV